MKRLFALLSIVCLTLSLLTACGGQEKAPEVTKPSAQPAPAATPAAAPAASPGKTGKVTETMNAAGYTYVQVDTGKEKFWAAAPQVQVKVGDSVAVPEGMPMPNYESKTLNRKFDLVYFVPSLLVNGAAPAGAAGAMPEGHPPTAGMPAGMPGMPGATGAPKVTAPADIDLKGIKKAEQTVADIFAQKTALAGKPVKIRGKVVKFSPEIMGKNWLHIQDGSGKDGTNDLTVNTSSVAKVGDTVVVSGKLTVAKDFGYGYQYDVIIEDAQVAKE
ncbi:MAG: nucleotide-binding protein [Desulfuromonas sp.]|nr:nucleotide-binding protein [Desulfuromonas sp.]